MNATPPQKPHDPAKEPHHAGLLLKRYGAVKLGEGDPAAGAGVLAAMALAIAGVRRPGSRVSTDDGATVGPHGGVIVSGSLLASLVEDKVLSHLQTFQSSVRFHNADYWRNKRLEESRPEPRRCESRVQPSGPSVIDTLDRRQDLMCGRREDYASQLLFFPAHYSDEELRQRPYFYTTLAAPGDIDAIAPLCHMGRLLARLPINDRSGFSRFGDQVLRLKDGFQPGVAHQHVSGDVLVIDHVEGLAGTVAEDSACSWISRLPWLLGTCPQSAFPQFPEIAVPSLKKPEEAFRGAMMRVLSNRLAPSENSAPTAGSIRCESHVYWLRFLRGLEPAFPGISGALRTLYPALVSGLAEICPSCRKDLNFGFEIEVLSFAAILARRMVAFRQRQLRNHNDADLARFRALVLAKLGNVPRSVRDIVRSCHKLPAEKCRNALESLRSAGNAVEVGGEWILADKHDTPTPIPVLIP